MSAAGRSLGRGILDTGDHLSYPDPGLRAVLDELDRRVADAGGRVYLAKDVRLTRGAFIRMYGDLDDWRAARAELDPGGSSALISAAVSDWSASEAAERTRVRAPHPPSLRHERNRPGDSGRARPPGGHRRTQTP
jgi:hypothetical protein